MTDTTPTEPTITQVSPHHVRFRVASTTEQRPSGPRAEMEAAEQAHRDDLARDIARFWATLHPNVQDGVGPGLHRRLELLAAAYLPDSAVQR